MLKDHNIIYTDIYINIHYYSFYKNEVLFGISLYIDIYINIHISISKYLFFLLPDNKLPHVYQLSVTHYHNMQIRSLNMA